MRCATEDTVQEKENYCVVAKREKQQNLQVREQKFEALYLSPCETMLSACPI